MKKIYVNSKENVVAFPGVEVVVRKRRNQINKAAKPKPKKQASVSDRLARIRKRAEPDTPQYCYYDKENDLLCINLPSRD